MGRKVCQKWPRLRERSSPALLFRRSVASGFESVRSRTQRWVPMVWVRAVGLRLYRRLQFRGRSRVVLAEEPVMSFVLLPVSGQ